MNTGLIISGAGHAGLILWVLVGGFFHPSRDVPEVAVTSVSLLSAKQYEELAAVFDLSVSACKMRVSRAREKLQQRYSEYRPDAVSNHGH